MTKSKRRSRIVVSYACVTIASILAAMTLSCSSPLQARREEAAKSAVKGQGMNAPQAKEETQSESTMTQEQGVQDEARKKPVLQPLEVDRMPKLIKEVKPEYPDLARESGYEATVVLKLIVNDSGDVAGVEILHSEAREFKTEFEAAAIDGVKQYKFKPAMKDGKPVCCMAMVTIKFQLE